MTSDAYRQFEDAFLSKLTPERALAGLNIAVLHQLSLAEKTQAETILLQRLHDTPADSRPVVGLGELCSKRALPALRQRLPEAQMLDVMETWPAGLAVSFIRVAVALWQIEAAEDALRYLLAVMRRLPHHHGRMEAAIALRHVCCREVIRTLLASLDDSSDLVRYHAMSSLLVLYDLWQEDSKSHPWATAMMSADAAQRSEAIAALSADIDLERFTPCLLGAA